MTEPVSVAWLVESYLAARRNAGFDSIEMVFRDHVRHREPPTSRFTVSTFSPSFQTRRPVSGTGPS
jgi:hypothetical protein